MEEEQELRLIIYGLGVLGLVAFLVALTHDLFGLEYENPKFGMIDIFIALMGLTLMLPSLLLSFSMRPLVIVLGGLGILLFLSALVHDMLGLSVSPNVVIGKIDLFVSLAGVVLLIPCILFFFVLEEEKTIWLAVAGIFLFFGALTHDALGLTFNKHPGRGPLDEIVTFVGVVLMSLFLVIRLHLNLERAKYVFVLGVAVFTFFVFHDLVGLSFSPNTSLGWIDSLFALWGLTLMVPYPLALAEQEKGRFHLTRR